MLTTSFKYSTVVNDEITSDHIADEPSSTHDLDRFGLGLTKKDAVDKQFYGSDLSSQFSVFSNRDSRSTLDNPFDLSIYMQIGL